MADLEDEIPVDSTSSDFVPNAIKRFQEIEEDERAIREAAKRDLQFVVGEQWDPKIKSDRERAGRPALTFNRLPVFVQRVANEARQQKPQIKFNPKDEDLKNTAEVFEGLARQIQYDSDAERAFENAIEYSAACSFGYFGIMTGYVDEDSFDQELKIRKFPDPFAVYGIMIPAIFGRKPYDAFVVEDLPKEEYKRLYPDSDLATKEEFAGAKNAWIGTETFRVGEYWRVGTKTETLYLLADGKITSENPKGTKQVKESREICRDTVKFYKINGVEVLETTEWVTRDIPIIAVLGSSRIVDGKAVVSSLVRDMLDAQTMINYAKTRIAETLADAPISPVIAAEGQLAGYEKDWQAANTKKVAYLQYKPVSIGGTVVPSPARQTFEPPIQSLSEFVAQEVDDLKATSGIFDQSLGMGTNDQSGLAIQRRQQQSDLTNMHYMDNLTHGFKQGGRIIAEAIPVVYDGARVVQILGSDETATAVQINKMFRDEQGAQIHHDIAGGAGKYDIIVSSGKAFSTKRMESFDMMQTLIQAAPGLLNVVGDILFANSDIAGSDVLAQRFKKMLPPNLQDEKDAPDPQQQLQQLQAQHQQLVQHLQQATQVIETKQVEQQAKVQVAQMQEQSRQAIVKMQEATKLAVAQINASKDANQAFAEQELKQYQIMHDAAHDVALQAHDHEHQQAMAQQQQAAQQQAAAQQAGHQADLSAQNAAQASAQQQQAQEQQQAGAE